MKRSSFGSASSNSVAKRKNEELDVRSHIVYLASLWPRAAFEDRIPPIVLKHQLYSLCRDRTDVDRQVSELVKAKEYRLFKLNITQDDYALALRDDFVKIFSVLDFKMPAGLKKLSQVLDHFEDVSVSSSDLRTQLNFTESEISDLVAAGVLVRRDVDKDVSWWFSIPGLGAYIKMLCKGRSLLLQMLKRAKHKEMLQQELKVRTLKSCSLPMEYLIHDLIGSDQVDCVDTSSGVLLRVSSN